MSRCPTCRQGNHASLWRWMCGAMLSVLLVAASAMGAMGWQSYARLDDRLLDHDKLFLELVRVVGELSGSVDRLAEEIDHGDTR